MKPGKLICQDCKIEFSEQDVELFLNHKCFELTPKSEYNDTVGDRTQRESITVQELYDFLAAAIKLGNAANLIYLEAEHEDGACYSVKSVYHWLPLDVSRNHIHLLTDELVMG